MLFIKTDYVQTFAKQTLKVFFTILYDLGKSFRHWTYFCKIQMNGLALTCKMLYQHDATYSIGEDIRKSWEQTKITVVFKNFGKC